MAARSNPEPPRRPETSPDPEAQSRALALARDLPDGYELTGADVVRIAGQVTGMSALFSRRSGATLVAVWQQLSSPIALEALHFDSSTDTYERMAAGGEIVSIKRIDRCQVFHVGHDGRLANFSADGIMSLSQLRRFATMHI